MNRARPRWVARALLLTRDKADTLLLLAGALLVLAPHFGHLPLWVSATCCATLAWRAALTLGGRRMPPALLLLPLAMAGMGGVLASYHTLLGRDAGVAMLVLLVAFKMLEMHARRDLFVVIFLCFFLVLTNFFYSQSMLTALLMAASIVVLLTAQLSFQFTGAVPPLRRRLWLGARIGLLAAPFALALFFLFPRIEGPLWGLPGDATGGRSGLSDSMAPGSLSQLAQSDETAFRVRFIDPAPAQERLYWRGLVLGAFDGQRWTQAPQQQQQRDGAAAPVAVALHGRPVRHEVTLEPSDKPWLFALELAGQLPQIAGNPARISAELELVAAHPIAQRVRYQVASYPDFNAQPGAQLPNAAQWLLLPWGTNPRAVEAGRALRRERDPGRRVAAVLEQFARAPFEYTLEPPLLGADSVDEFLYVTRSGFCEHYAGAFVFLMRAAGVPARVVTGYQGGETNPVDGVLTVRQSDAHAWAEVWLAGRGWVRVDPTAAVAPDRVRHNLARALPQSAPFGIEGLGGLADFAAGPDSLLAQLRHRFGALDNQWNQWVLNYTPQRQRGVFDELKAALLNRQALAALAAIVALLLLARALRQRSRGDPIDTLYSALCLQLGRSGMARAPDEGPSAYALRLAALDLPAPRKAAAARFLALYSAYKYGARGPDAGLVATLKRLLSESR